MGEHNLLNPGFVGPLVNIHTGDTFYFPNPSLGSPVSINPSFGRACDLARVEEPKCYYRESCSETPGLKREERGRDGALLPLESSLPNGMGGNFGKYDYPSSEAVAHDPPSCQSLES
ncbi:PREDICTED: homeobox protein Hox-C12, partial [Mesitornis unicolor]|uniref:homeobox protein Hox-C12 n=1 Tax=Mesitornis unicolor TaxID=54374 RepID=UPI000528BFDD